MTDQNATAPTPIGFDGPERDEINAAAEINAEARAREAEIDHERQRIRDAIAQPFEVAKALAERSSAKALLHDAIDTNARPVGLWRGEVGVLLGEGGCGKSWLTLRIAWQLARGAAVGRAAIGDGATVMHALTEPSNTRPGRVLLVTAEDSAGIVADRLAKLGANPAPPGLHVLDVSEGSAQLVTAQTVSRTIEGDKRVTESEINPTDLLNTIQDELVSAKERGEGFDLVVLDPLSRFQPPDKENDNGVGAAVLRLLQGLAKASGAAVLVCHHTNKEARDAETGKVATNNASRGASAITDGARTVMHLAPKWEDDKSRSPTRALFAVTKASHAKQWNDGRWTEIPHPSPEGAKAKPTRQNDEFAGMP